MIYTIVFVSKLRVKLGPLATDIEYMKNILIFTCLVFCFQFFLQGCTRAANTDSAKIQIMLPPESAILNSKINELSNGVTEPTTHDEINCYLVFVGGPEKDLTVNACRVGKNSERNSSAPPSGGAFNFGIWKGGVAAGREISMEIPSGTDRVINLVGIKLPSSESCRDFKSLGWPEKNSMSNAYLLGTAGRVNLRAGDVTQVPVIMKFDADKTILGCQGPDVPNPGGKDGDGNNNGGPYLRFENIGRFDSLINRELATVGRCYQTKVGLFQGQGNSYIETSNVIVNVAGVTVGKFFSESTCSPGNEITTMTVEAGVNRSLNNYYFKATTPIIGGSFDGYTTTGNASAFSTNKQMIDLGGLRLGIQGPNRVIVNECFRYDISSQYFEGGSFNVTADQTISLNSNASFVIKDSSGCSGASDITISSGTANSAFYLKLLSPAPVNLHENISTTGFGVAPFVVNNAAGQNYSDGLTLHFENDTIVRGKCNKGSIRLVNHDGGSINAIDPITIRVKGPQGAGVFATMAGCSSGTTEEVTIFANSPSVDIYYKAHAIPSSLLIAGKLPLRIDAGAIKLRGIAPFTESDFLLNVVDPPEMQYFLVDPPNFKGAEIIGSHEFVDSGTSKYINLISNYSNMPQDVECSVTSGSGFVSCTAAEVDRSSIPYKFKWDSTVAISGASRFVRFVYPGGAYTPQEKIDKSIMYGPKFRILSCNAVASPGLAKNYSDIPTGDVVCLPSLSKYRREDAVGLALGGTRFSIIGHSDGTSILNGNTGSFSSGDLIYMSSPTLTSDSIIANIRLEEIPNTYQGIKLDGPAPSGSKNIEINNISVNEGSTANATIIKLNASFDANLNFIIRNNKIVLLNGGQRIVYAYDTNNLNVEDNFFRNMGNNDANRVLDIDNSGEPTAGNNTKIVRNYLEVDSGKALNYDNTGVTNGFGFILRNNRFVKTGVSSVTNTVVYLKNRITGGIIENNMFYSGPAIANAGLIEIYSMSQPAVSTFVGNTLIQGLSSAPGLIIGGSLSTSGLNEFSRNSFSYVGGSDSSTAAIKVSPGAYFTPNSTNGQTGYGNLVCTSSAATFPRYFVGGGGTVNGVGTVGLDTIPVSTSNMAANSGRCQSP